MKRLKRTFLPVSLAALLLLQSYGLQAGELIINNGSSMTIEADSTLILNCDTLTLEDGSTLINNGAISKLGRLVEKTGSSYTDTGTVEKCNKSFYIIRAINGKTVIICL